MRIAHIADTHLGYRAYNRVTSQGVNRREADVFQAFRYALAKVAEIEPDLIVIAGDVFHVVRPSNLTIQQTFREFAALRRKTSAPIVLIGGNHDSPRSADTGCILDLLTNLPDIHVVHSEYLQVKLEDLDASVFCLCHRALPHLSSLRIEPDPASTRNILLVHGTLEGIARYAYDLYEINRSQVISDGWDYIAFGHYHIFTKLADNAYYAGSLEYTSSNIWHETKQLKGFIEYDAGERELVKFHAVPTRKVIDLQPIDATDLTASELDTKIQLRVDSIEGGCDDKIIRLVVESLPRAVQADLDYSAIREIRARALHFDLQIRRPSRSSLSEGREDQDDHARTVEEEWSEFAASHDIPSGVDREKFVSIGRQYLTKEEAAARP